MKDDILVSVIIPTYRPKSYLWECLDSICGQDFPKEDYEIILVLNGCNMPFDKQIKEYINRHDHIHIRYVQTDVAGVSHARNMALDYARGDFIAFIDDDDYVSPSYLRELYERSNSETVALAYPYAFNDGEPETQLDYSITREYERCSERGAQPAYRPKKFFSGPCMKLIHRDIIAGRRYDVRFRNGEDSIYMFLLSDKIKKVDFTSTAAVYYRRFRQGSATTRAMGMGEVAQNCWRMFLAYSHIYISNIAKYSIRRYAIAFFGLAHIMLNKAMGGVIPEGNFIDTYGVSGSSPVSNNIWRTAA